MALSNFKASDSPARTSSQHFSTLPPPSHSAPTHHCSHAGLPTPVVKHRKRPVPHGLSCEASTVQEPFPRHTCGFLTSFILISSEMTQD